MSTDTPFLVARDISKTYGVVHALDGVDFEVRPGEIVALAGENGSGKSTLAKTLAGAVRPDAGAMTIDGEEVRFTSPRDALARGVSLVAQEPTAVPGISVAENVLLAQLPVGLAPFRRRAYARRAQTALDLVGVRVDARATFASLRPGDRELVEVAKALALAPRLLILDEATSRFGAADVERLFELLRRLRDAGTSVVLITHRLAEICEVADRVVVLRDGRRVGELPRAELREERIAAMMVGRELEDFFHKRDVPASDVVLRVEGLVVEDTTEPVSLEVRAGELVALSGLVGSGRTELLETIYGARRAKAGRVLIAGRTVRRNSPRASLRAGVALVPEERHRQGLNLSASVKDNLVLGSWGLIYANPGRERDVGRDAVRRFRIRTPALDASIRALSGGNQQKVVVARCLRRRPRVLLLDEPTRGIDVGAKEEIFELIGRMLEERVAILMVSSDLLEVLGLADRVLVMHDRRIAGELARDEATEERIAYLSGGGTEQRVA